MAGDGHRDDSADRADADLPEPHHLRPDGRRRQGLRHCLPASVLFLTCHDLGQHLGCYGQATVTSPALDAPGRERACVSRAASAPRRSAVRVARRCTPVATRTAPACWVWRTRRTAGASTRANGTSPTCWPTPATRTTLVGMQHLIERGSAHELGYQRRAARSRQPYDEAAAAVALLRELAAPGAAVLSRGRLRGAASTVRFRRRRSPIAAAAWPCRRTCPTFPRRAQDLAAFQGAIRQMDHGVGAHPGRAGRSRPRRQHLRRCSPPITARRCRAPSARCTTRASRSRCCGAGRRRASRAGASSRNW